MFRMVLFAKLETDSAYTPLTISPSISSLTTVLRQRFTQLQTLKVKVN